MGSWPPILPEIAALLPPEGHLISLVKPQFELNAEALDKRGVVRDARRYNDVETNIRSACDACGLAIRHWQESPITGGDGNREFLLHAIKERKKGAGKEYQVDEGGVS